MRFSPEELGEVAAKTLRALQKSKDVPEDMNGVELATVLRAAASLVETAMAGQAMVIAMERALSGD